MRSKMIIGGVIVIVLIAGVSGGVFFKMKGKRDAASLPQPAETSSNLSPQTMTDEEPVAPEKKSSLLDFLTTKGAIRCSITSKEGQKYTVSSDGKRARVEGIMVPGKNPTEGNVPGMMINDGQFSYIWSGTQGMKFDMTEMIKNAATQPVPNGAPADPKDWKGWAKSLEDSGVTYDCGAATVSDTDFTPPATVQFTDLSQMMKQVQKGMPTQGTPPSGFVPGMQRPTSTSGASVQQ